MDNIDKRRPKVPTIIDAFRLKTTLNPKTHLNNCPINSYRPSIKIYYTICDNGSRRIPKYYLNGVEVNALGFPLSKHDKKFIHKHKCTGCNNNRCVSHKYYTPSTAYTHTSNDNRNSMYPYPTKYFSGPLTTI